MEIFPCLRVVFLIALAPVGDAKIIGGEDTDITTVPYQLALLHNNTTVPVCGAVIIGEHEAVTAGHCVDGKSGSALRLHAGSSTLDGGSTHHVSQVHIHEEYRNLHHDIAFLRVHEPFLYGDAVQPVDIIDREPAEGSKALVSGWGRITNRGPLPKTLQSVAVQVVGRKKCEETYGKDIATPDVICAGDLQGGRGSCDGDSGGPLVVDGKLAGIVSFRNAEGCATANYPSGYANIAYMRNWLLDRLRESQSSLH